MPVRGAVWDLGSSSFHLLVCEVGPRRSLYPVLRRRALLNLGASVGASGEISHDRVTAAVSSARRLKGQLDTAGADVVVAVATAALRDASNGPEVVERLEQAVGTRITVLGGGEEARLCFVGQQAGVWMPEGWVLGIDLGGGSLELAVGPGRRRLEPNDIGTGANTGKNGNASLEQRLGFAESVPLGPTRLSGELATGEVLDSEDIATVRKRTSEVITPFRARLSSFAGVAARVVLSGGTARALARIATSSSRRPTEASSAYVNQVELPTEQVEELALELARMSLAQRMEMPGMPARRAPVLPLGATILAALAAELRIERYVVSEWGLREGALLDALDTAASTSQAVEPTEAVEPTKAGNAK